MKKTALVLCLIFFAAAVGTKPAMAQMKTEVYFFDTSTVIKTSDAKSLVSSIVAAYLSETAFLKAAQERAAAPMYFGEFGPGGFNRFSWLVPNGVKLPPFSVPFAPGFLDKANWDVVISGIQAPVMGSSNAYLRITIKF